MVSVSDHQSYRGFLTALLAEGKAQRPALTLTRLARKFGMSVSALQMVINGQRNLTVHRLHQIAHALGFDEAEEEIFAAMVHAEQATTKREREFYWAKLKTRASKQKVSVRRVATQDLLSEWYMPALLVFFLDSKGEPDFGLAEKKIGIKSAEAKVIFQRMQTLGFLKKKSSDEKFHLVYDKMAASFPREEFMVKLLREVEKRLRQDFRSDQSYFEAHTLNICRERFPEFVADYKKLLAHYIELGPQAKDSVIYQSFQAFLPIL